MTTLSRAEQFFYDHAGYSWDPKKELPEDGRVGCARELALAEAWASEHRIRFSWQRDDAEPDHYMCLAIAPGHGTCVSALGGIDTDEEPVRRVVEAELAQDVMMSVRKGNLVLSDA